MVDIEMYSHNIYTSKIVSLLEEKKPKKKKQLLKRSSNFAHQMSWPKFLNQYEKGATSPPPTPPNITRLSVQNKKYAELTTVKCVS